MRTATKGIRHRVAAIAMALGLASSAAVLGLPGAVHAQPLLKASVGYYPGALISLPVLIAHDRKIFEHDGLAVRLVPISTGPAMTSAVASDSVTFVNNSWDNLLVAVEHGLPIRGVIGSTVKVPFALIARKGMPLPHLAQGYPGVIKDLVGKKWGVLALGVSLQYMDEKLLTDAGYKANSVTYVAVGLPNTAFPALQRGIVDTYLSIEPLPSIVEAKHEGTVVVNLAENQGPAAFHDLGYNGWWASTSTIRNHPEVVARFVKAMEDSYCWYRNPANLGAVVSIMQHYAKVPALTPAEYKTMVQRLIPTFGLKITRHTIDTWSQLLYSQGQLHAPGKRSAVVIRTGAEHFACSR